MDSIGFILVILWASMLVEAQPTSTVNVTSTPIPASSDDGMWYDVFTGSFLPWGYIGIGIGVAFALSVGIVCCLCCIKKKKTNPNFSHRPQQQQQQTHQRLQDATPLTRSGSISAAMNPIKQAFPNNNNNDSDVEVRTISRSQTPMTNTSVRRARPPPPASQPKSVSFRSVTPTTPHSETRKALLPATPPSGRKSAPNTPKGGPPVMARPLQGPATITNSARRKCFEIYGFGRNVEGQLGVLEGGDIFTPILIRIDESLTTGNKEVVRDVAVACGSYHTLIMVNGRLFVTGEGTYGQLGLNDASSVNTLICNDFFNAEDDNRVLKIAAGEQHSIVVSTQGVYSFGCGSEGQLGLGDFSDSIYPERIPAFTGPGSEVEIVASGSHHNVVVIRRARGANTPPVQEVYTFGWNQNGQLMVGHMTSLATPTLIPFFEHVHVIAVSCGVTHTVVLGGLGAQRNVYVCGAGNYGQLGLMGAIECISVPQPIPFFSHRKVTGIHAWYHTVVVADDGVYTFGEGSMGKLGHGGNNAGKDEHFPRRVVTLDGRTVSGVWAGSEHSAAVCEGFGLMMWGSGSHGKLGSGSDEIVPVPTCATLLPRGEVWAVSLGVAHTIVVLDVSTS